MIICERKALAKMKQDTNTIKRALALLNEKPCVDA